MTRNIAVARFVRSILIVSTALLLNGCIKSKILVKVKKDGSGNIVITRVFSKEVVAMFQAQMAEMQKYRDENVEITIPEDPFYNEKILKREAFLFGPGVTFVEARKYAKAGARGSIAVYSFKDINDIFINMESMGPQNQMGMAAYSSMDEEPEVAEKEDEAFEFKLVKGKVNKLTIVCPDYPKIEPEEEEDAESDEPAPDELHEESLPASELEILMGGGNPFGFTGNETQTDVMQRITKGALISVAVQVAGTVTKSDASHPHSKKKGRYALLEIDMETLLSSPKGAKIANPTEIERLASPLDFFALIQNLPGVKIETKKEVNVEFK